MTSAHSTFSSLPGFKAKARYIWDYYKLPVIFFCIVLYIIGYTVYGHYTQKTPVLSVAFVNFAPGEELSEQLGNDFLKTLKINDSENEIRLYKGLYLTDNENDPNHEYTYASRMKILGSIDSKSLDVVLMNKEAFDAFSQNGYLCNLEDLIKGTDSQLYQKVAPFLQTNTEILKDNSLDVYLDHSVTYSAQTTEYSMGLDLSESGYIKNAGMNGTVYLGVISNSPHLSEAVSYIDYLFA